VNIRGFFTDNIAFKIVALIGALALWFFVAHRGQAETTIEANIDFKNVPAGLEILKQNVKRVNVSVGGHEVILGGLKPSDVRVVVDLSNSRKGESVHYFDINDVKSRYNLKFKRLEPTSLKVYLDESVSKNFRVIPNVVGEPARGHEVKKVIVDPSSITVEGAKTEMARMSSLRTEIVDISGLDTTIHQQARLDLNNRNVRIKSPEVSITVMIGKKGK
jgi:YbbR domain-containing protein